MRRFLPSTLVPALGSLLLITAGGCGGRLSVPGSSTDTGGSAGAGGGTVGNASANGSGSGSGSGNASVASPDLTYTIGGTVTGLVSDAGGTNPVVLEDNLADPLTLNADGSFTFATPIAQGQPYSVTVRTNPASPLQHCSVANGSGTVSSGNVTSVAVDCTTPPSGDCGRFATGFKGSWDTTVIQIPTGFGYATGVSAYLPAGGTATVYMVGADLLNEYDALPNAFTSLAYAPPTLNYYSSLAWSGGTLYSINLGMLSAYDRTASTWSTVSAGIALSDSRFYSQTTADDAGGLWSFGSASTLIHYDIAGGTAVAVSIPTPDTGIEARITYDACSGLLYFTNYASSLFYSYDPVSGAQTALSNPFPTYGYFAHGFCGDRSGHIFAMTSSNAMYQYTIATDTWVPLPDGGPAPENAGISACGVGSDGMLYALVSTDNYPGPTMSRIPLD